MKIIITENKEELAKSASKEMLEVITNKPNATLGLATGSTPIGMYKKMIEDHEKNGTSYKSIKTFNLDEYVGLQPTHKESYINFMKTNLFNHIDINLENVNIPNGLANNINKECARYSNLLEKNSIDIQVLGIGSNGHIAFNEPGTSFESKTHQVMLTENTIKDNARFFNNIDEVPKSALTMGISEIMKAKKIIILANGANKANAVYQMVKGKINENCPASILQKHDNVVVIVDKLAGSKL